MISKYEPQIEFVPLFVVLGASSRQMIVMLEILLKLFEGMLLETVSKMSWRSASVCWDRTCPIKMTIVSQRNTSHWYSLFMIYLGTLWDVLALKAVVFSIDTAQIITAQPLLQGYFVILIWHSGYIWDSFQGCLTAHATLVFTHCHNFIVFALHSSESFVSATGKYFFDNTVEIVFCYVTAV